jgi:hypothetical protein
LKIVIVFLLFFLTGCVSEPEINIDGLKNGKTFPKEVTIHLDDKNLGKYTMFLNGDTIQNDHKVTENGEYELTIKASNLWKEKLKTITFKIDDQPPLKPSFHPEIKPINYKHVTFNLIVEKGVTYSAKINGKPFDLSNKFEQEGTHVLFVMAKKENGLSTTSRFFFTIDNRTYSKETIGRFTNFYFTNENKNIIKWMNTIELFYHGNPSSRDIQILKSHVKALNENLPIKIIVRDSVAKRNRINRIDMYFVPNYKFKDYGFRGDIISNNIEIVGLATPISYSLGELTKAQILIDTNTSQRVRESTILHELVHALGFYVHTKDKSSILYPTDINVTRLSDFDKKIVELLYREDIEPNMSQRDVEQVLKPRIIN